jgi:signal transduction histidine kinase/CheY-like chemotaxis protein
MNLGREYPELQKSLTELRIESLRLISLLATAAGYVYLMWITDRVGHSKPVPGSAWAAVGFLFVGSITAYVLRDRRPSLASRLLIWSVLIAVLCTVHTSRSLSAAYLFILPIIFASVLVSQAMFFLAAAVSSALILALVPSIVGMPPFPSAILLPTGIIVLVTVASWLSARNLHTALSWVWNGYEQARRNEDIAYERRAELRRALKALDEATHRLERANYVLLIARDQAEEARRLKQQFAQTISHELRTPLNLIVGFTELMAHSPEYYGGPLSTTYLRDLSIVYRNACHLQELVNDVLDLARIEAAQMSLALEETDPAALVEEAVHTAHSLVEARGLTLYTEIEPGLPQVWVDPTRIRQVLINLLNNASRFTDEGSVTVSVRREDSNVVFAVADTGIGIAPKDLDRIFEEFHQVNEGRRRQGGAGLGLAISREFVQLHGGRIWVESQIDQGSTFGFSLPMERDQVHVDQLAETLATRTTSAGEREKPVLLVVTRSPSAIAMLGRYVQNCRLVVVPDLAQVQRAVQQSIPQAVVIDSAYEVNPGGLGALGRAWQLLDVPLVLCPLPGEELLRQQLAVDGYLAKPVSRQSLWDVLRRFGENIDRVLVIDDDQDFVLFMSRILEDNPVRRYQVISAGGGREGLAMIQHYQPDLIFLDLMMVDMDGFEVIERVRADPTWQQIPIVVVSAQEEIDQQEVLAEAVTFAKAGGLKPGDIVRWVQNAVSPALTPPPASSAQRATPVL